MGKFSRPDYSKIWVQWNLYINFLSELSHCSLLEGESQLLREDFSQMTKNFQV